MPAIVLKPTLELRRRVMCLLHRDFGTVQYACSPIGWRSDDASACRPGCPATGNWCHSVAGQNWYCAFQPDELASMMREQDELLKGHVGHLDNVRDSDGYNELVLDTWRYPWEPELSSLVEAVSVPTRATSGAKRYGLAVHAALEQKLGASIPLLAYDAQAGTDPFTRL